MSDKITKLQTTTFLDLPVNAVLEGAVDRITNVVIMGYDKDGDYYFASSIAEGPDILWLLEQYKKRILETAREGQ